MTKDISKEEQMRAEFEAQAKSVPVATLVVTDHGVSVTDLRWHTKFNLPVGNYPMYLKCASDQEVLWDLRDHIMNALFSKACPHAWESIVAKSSAEFITATPKSAGPLRVYCSRPDGGI